MASIKKLTTSDGVRWRARYRTPDGESREKWLRNRAEAERYITTVESSKLRGVFADPALGRKTVGEWIGQWEATRMDRRPATRARDTSIISRHIVPVFGRRELRTLQPAEVRKWVATLATSGLSSRTVRKAAQLLAAALEAAVEDGLIGRSPARGLKLPLVDPEEQKFITVTEIAKLTMEIDQRYKPMVLLAAYGGLRWGEVAGLRVHRLDLLRRTVTVVETLTDVKGRVEVGPPKTTSSRRRVVLPRFVCDALSAHLVSYPPDPATGPGVLGTGRGTYTTGELAATGLVACHPGRRVRGASVPLPPSLPRRHGGGAG